MFTECDLFPTSSIIVAMGRVLMFKLANVYDTGVKDIKPMSFILFNHIIIFVIQGIVYVLLLVLFEKRIIGSLINSCLNRYSFSKHTSKGSVIAEPLLTGGGKEGEEAQEG